MVRPRVLRRLRRRRASPVAPTETLWPHALGDDGAEIDPITRAVVAGWTRGNGGRRVGKADETEARDWFLQARHGAVQQQRALGELLRLITEYPDDDRLQIRAARLLESAGDAQAAAAWRRLVERLPPSDGVIIETIRRARQNFGYPRARELLQQYFPDMPAGADALLLYFILLNDLKEYQTAATVAERLLTLGDVTEKHVFGVARHYRQRGEIVRAHDFARRGIERLPRSDRLARLVRETEGEIARLTALAPIQGSGVPLGAHLFEEALRLAAGSRAFVSREPQGFIGPVVLVGGSLGAGGAERQFTTTAAALQRAMQSGTPIAGLDIVGPVNVICHTLFSRPDGGFFLRDLEALAIPIEQYLMFPPWGGRARASAARHLDPILRYLPESAAEGTRKLTDVLLARSPQIVHLWQDGMILAGMLAALVARVPRIILTARSSPPVDRPERHLPEYEPLYKTALALPGVRLLTNSGTNARRYAQWLGLEPGRIGVVYNGIEPLPEEGDAAARQLLAGRRWENREEGFVVGSVMRFDDNKRPHLCIEVASAVLRRAPDSRFIFVGDGPLWESAAELVERLGIADRVLFTGRSHCVGFWLAQMSVLFLLSRHEGLPNILIEAQAAGVPVVATPAGGAGETFTERTGTLLPSAEEVEVEGVADALLRWRLDPAQRRRVGHQAQQWARRRFSVDAMVEATVRAYRG